MVVRRKVVIVVGEGDSEEEGEVAAAAAVPHTALAWGAFLSFYARVWSKQMYRVTVGVIMRLVVMLARMVVAAVEMLPWSLMVMLLWSCRLRRRGMMMLRWVVLLVRRRRGLGMRRESRGAAEVFLGCHSGPSQSHCPSGCLR